MSKETSEKEPSASNKQEEKKTEPHLHVKASGNAVLVSPRQRGNPLLKFITNVPWEFDDRMLADYVMGQTTCALYLSVRYHNLNPDYIHDRLKILGKNYLLRVLLVMVDISEPHQALKTLTRISILADLTLMLCRSPEEAGKIIERYKIYQYKPPDLIMEKKEEDAYSRLISALTTIRSVNKTDATILLSTFGTLESILKASESSLSLCPGIGPQKAARLYKALHQPFLKDDTYTPTKKEIVFLAFLVVIAQTAGKEIRKKPTESVKVVENLSPSTPAARFEEKQGSTKGEVVVETIKSISPADYLTTTGSFEGSTPSKKVPFATVTYNAFEPETPKKLVNLGSGITEISSAKKKPNYRYYTTGASSTQKLGTSTVQVSSTISPAPVRITSAEPDSTLLPNNQFTAQSSSVSQDISSTLGDSIITDRPLKIPIIKAKINNNNRYTLAKILKRPGKFDLKLSDSKPEETGFNGYHFDIGTLNVHSKPGMTGASYMRSSSPYYNFHVMLD